MTIRIGIYDGNIDDKEIWRPYSGERGPVKEYKKHQLNSAFEYARLQSKKKQTMGVFKNNKLLRVYMNGRLSFINYKHKKVKFATDDDVDKYEYENR